MDNEKLERRKSSYCPKCRSDFRFKENSMLICSKCGYEIEAKRELDSQSLPVWEKEKLTEGGY